jgi:hypothetical protein
VGHRLRGPRATAGAAHDDRLADRPRRRRERPLPDYAFGPATASFDLELPGDAIGGVAWLRASQQPLEDALAGLDDDALDEARLTNWGERLPTWRLFDILVIEQVHHGAEISLLRDLYRQRTTLRA